MEFTLVKFNYTDIESFIKLKNDQNIFYIKDVPKNEFIKQTNIQNKDGSYVNDFHFDLITNIQFKSALLENEEERKELIFDTYDQRFFTLNDNDYLLKDMNSADVITLNSLLRNKLLNLPRNKIKFNLNYFEEVLGVKFIE